MKRYLFSVMFLVTLCISEIILLALATGGFPSPTDRRLIRVASEFTRSPNTQTELDLYKELARTERTEVIIERVSSLIVVLNTIALMSALRYVKRLRKQRNRSASADG
jgi:hypothetical protein